jgi:arginyl-tRNA--protein-N-Asp/Glu arginylyltransferase
MTIWSGEKGRRPTVNPVAGSLGRAIILRGSAAGHDAHRRSQKDGRAGSYLGYWVPGSRKMDYKGRFLPQERLMPAGWTRVEK